MSFFDKIHAWFNCKCKKCCPGTKDCCKEETPVATQPVAPVVEQAPTEGGSAQM